jgi:hypothetical protein
LLDDEEYLELYHGKVVKIPLKKSYSESGSTPIVYSLGATSPSWASIDSSSGVLTVDTSQITIEMIYSVQVEIAVSVSTWTQMKTVKLRSLNWENLDKKGIGCLDCQYINVTKCGDCIYGYEVSEPQGIWVEAEPTAAAKAAQAASQALGGAGIMAGGAISLMTLSSPLAIWLIANQLQLLMLLLLTGAYLPPSIIALFTGSSYLTFSLNLISVESIPVINVIPKIVGFDQSNEYLYEMGLTSGSTLTANMMFFFSIFAIIVIHMLIWLWKTWRKKKANLESNSRWKAFKNKINELFEFAIYIRLFIGAFQFMLLSSISEIKRFELKETKYLVSLILSFVIVLFCVCFSLFSILLLFTSKDKLIKNYIRFKETFSGLKDAKVQKFYVIFTMLLRKLFYVWFLLWIAHNMMVTNVIMIMLIVEAWVWVYLFTVRPYQKVQNIILEVINEGFFVVLTASLFFINKQEHWNELYELIFMMIVTCNNLAVWLVLFGKYFQINFRVLDQSDCGQN